MIFSKEFKTTWHDTDAHRRVRPTQLLAYMQETSNAHLTGLGWDLDQLRDSRGLAFILSKIKFAICAPLYAYEDITVDTWTCPGRGYAFNRMYRIRRGEELIAIADTVWALVDINSHSLCKSDIIDFPFEHEEQIDIGLPQRFRVPKTEELDLLGERRIVYSDLDYNMHMNNTRYADMICDFLPLERVDKICGMSLSYLHEAHFGDTVKVYGKDLGGKYNVRTINEAGESCLEAEVLFG